MTAQLDVNTIQPAIRMLSDAQIEAIDLASMDVLSRTGIVMKNESARQLLLDHGAIACDDRILIPEHMVREAIASAPSRIPMHTRDGELTMPLEYGQVFFGPGSDCTFHIDLESGQRRRATAEDVCRVATLCDGLEQIDFIMSMGNPSDVPPLDIYIHEFISMIRGSRKPVVYTANNRRDMEDIFQIAAATAGGEDELRRKPFLLLYAEPISPLLFNADSVDKLMFCAEKGIPVTYPPSPNTGGGGPISMAGALTLGNAEVLAGLVVHQLVRRGAPFLYGMNTAALDMRTTIVSYGSPEFAMGMAAHSDLGRYYQLPIWGTAGASDSKTIDTQVGIEQTVSVMLAFLSRCNLVHDVGYLEYGSTSSLESLVIVDEVIREVRHVVAGIEVSPRALAREAIHAVRPGGGFLGEDHTLEHFGWAQWQPGLIDRLRHGAWEQRGNEKARVILAEHRPAPLPDATETAIRDVLDRRARAVATA